MNNNNLHNYPPLFFEAGKGLFKGVYSPLWPCLAILLALVITTAASTNPAASLVFSASWGLAVVGWGVASLIRPAWAWLLPTAVVLLSVAVMTGVSVQAWQGVARPVAFLAGPNLAAIVIVFGALLAYAGLPRPLGWVVAGAALMPVLHTGSRSAVVAFVVGSLVFVVLDGVAGRIPRREIGAAVGMILVAGVAALVLIRAQRPELAIEDAARAGVYYRWDFWRVALEGFTLRPLVGHGPGTYRALWVEYGPVGSFPFHAAHNLPLNIAAEQGLIGLAAWLWLAVALAVWLHQSWANTPMQRGILAVLAAFAVHALFDTPEWDILLMVGCLVAMWKHLGFRPLLPYTVPEQA